MYESSSEASEGASWGQIGLKKTEIAQLPRLVISFSFSLLSHKISFHPIEKSNITLQRLNKNNLLGKKERCFD